MKVKSFLVSGSGMLGSQMISLLSLPLLTRLFEPAAYAQWAIVQAIVLFVGAIASLRYDLAIVVEREDDMASALFWLAALAGCCVALLTAVVLVLIGFIGSPDQEWLSNTQTLVISLFWVLTATISPAFTGWCLRKGRFAIMSATQISIAATTLAVQAGGGLWSGGNASWRWLLVGSAAGQAVGLIVLTAQFIKPEYRPSALKAVGRKIGSAGRRHFKFVKFSLPFTVFGAVRDRLPLFVTGAWVSQRELGLYSQAWRLSNVPAGLTGAVIRPVLFHASAETGLASLETTINRILLLLILAGVPLLAAVMAFPSEVLGWVLGARWREIGPIIAPLLVPAFIFSISNWMDRLLDSTGRQDLNLTTEIVSGVTSVAALVVVLSLGGGLHAAVAAQSAVLSLNYLALIYVVYKVAGYDRRKLLLLLLTGLIIYALCFLTAVAVSHRAAS